MKREPTQFIEGILVILEEGRFTATYKFAVLLALIDLCIEYTTEKGFAPPMLTTGQVAEKIIELYWPHARMFEGEAVLRQNTKGQAYILSRISAFQMKVSGSGHPLLFEAKSTDPSGFERLLRAVEWKLIEMPLPRLQNLGDKKSELLYTLGWDSTIREEQVRSSAFDNRILFKEGAADALSRLGGLLRPLIQRRWVEMVVEINKENLKDPGLEHFLFGCDRKKLVPLAGDLRDIQDKRCFYCGEQLSDKIDVDHFIPWARYPDNTIHNLVAAHGKCNGAKKAHLAASPHVTNWTKRFDLTAQINRDLTQVADHRKWELRPDRTLGVARSLYLRLGDEAMLWLRNKEFTPPNRDVIKRALLINHA
ncbi:HNH endonuclease [Elusimicrobiota bacterium]